MLKVFALFKAIIITNLIHQVSQLLKVEFKELVDIA